MKTQHKILVSNKYERVKPLGRPSCRWYDNIKVISYKKRASENGVDATGYGQSRETGSCDNGNKTSCSLNGNTIKDLKFLDQITDKSV